MSDELKELLSSMDVPHERIKNNDYFWFLRNLPIHNGNHPNFGPAMELIQKELRIVIV